MECWGVFQFLPELINRHSAKLGREVRIWKQVVNSFIQHIRTMQDSPKVTSVTQLQTLTDTFHSVVGGLASIVDFRWTPKFHLWGHMVAEARSVGNPKFWSTFLDESLNGVLKKSARLVHGGEKSKSRMFWRMGYLMTRAASRRIKRPKR